MTGHLLYGKYEYNKKENKWTPHKNERESLKDSYNRFIHVIFEFSNGKHLAFCDSRKFGKVTLINEENLESNLHLKNIGPEPLEENFYFENFKERLYSKPNKSIKTVLMDQKVIAGIGNIYSDEMLHTSGIHPESHSVKIPIDKLRLLYKSMKEVLNKGIKFKGDSMSDYRNINGEKGEFQNKHNVYKKKNERCSKKNCRGVIIRKVINGRSAHFCNTCQKLFN
jgi:formamidopyrimidine-DNA glycosylase